MPTYLGKAVSDEWLNELVNAYRDGQRDAGVPVEDGDQIIINRLSSQQVMSPRAPSAYALAVSDSKTSAS